MSHIEYERGKSHRKSQEHANTKRHTIWANCLLASGGIDLVLWLQQSYLLYLMYICFKIFRLSSPCVPFI